MMGWSMLQKTIKLGVRIMKMLTYTGKIFDPLDMNVEDVDIKDIAHALSYSCRFNGHCRNFYSIAEHSYAVSRYLEFIGCDARIQMRGLLHDGAEAYLGDIIRPIKQEVSVLEIYERFILDRIFIKYEVKLSTPSPGDLDLIIMEADDKILLTEAERLIDGDTSCWNLNCTASLSKEALQKSMPEVHFGWSPVYSEMKFLERFNKLTERVSK